MELYDQLRPMAVVKYSVFGQITIENLFKIITKLINIKTY